MSADKSRFVDEKNIFDAVLSGRNGRGKPAAPMPMMIRSNLVSSPVSANTEDGNIANKVKLAEKFLLRI